MIATIEATEKKKKKKNILKEIISENWEDFKKRYPEFNKPQYNDAVEKMLGDPEKLSN